MAGLRADVDAFPVLLRILLRIDWSGDQNDTRRAFDTTRLTRAYESDTSDGASAGQVWRSNCCQSDHIRSPRLYVDLRSMHRRHDFFALGDGRGLSHRLF